MALSQETAVAMVALVVAVPQAIVVVWAWWTKCRCMLARNQSTDDSSASSAESRCQSGQIRGTPLPSDLRIGASISLEVLFLCQSTGIVGFDLG
ncbi:hypothetical protein VCV18_008928 [Metarhizium anisopliae]